MRMSTAWIALMAAGFWAAPGSAQDRQEALPEVAAEGEAVPPPVKLGSGVDAGSSVIERQDIELRTPGSGDVNRLLKILPTAQFTRDEHVASRDAIQDIRPADVSISGGLYYDNRVSLDAIDVHSRLDVTNTNPQNGNEVAGASAQTLWVDSELVGKVTVRDSNVSAEYGNFTGGTLEIETRDPRRVLGAAASLAYTGDSLTHFKISDAARAALGSAPPPKPPEFDQWRLGATIDVPFGNDAAVMIGYNRAQSRVVHYANARYATAARRYSSISDNVLVRGVYDIDAATKLVGQFVYSPYSSESGADAGVDNTVDTKGGGITGKLELDHAGAIDWNVAASYSLSDTSRTAPGVQYNIPVATTNGGFCTNDSCTTGGIGDLDQTQKLYGLKATIGGDLGAVRLRGGIDFEHVDAHRSRPKDVLAYSRGVVDTRIKCVDGESLACATGQYALGQYNYNQAYDAKVDLDAIGVWSEAQVDLDAVTLRAGLRYDYESFLGNHVLAPRLSAAYRLPWQGIELSVGANRYYGTSMVSYALREQYPSLRLYRRNGVSSGGSLLYSEAGWSLYSVTNSTIYSNSGLKTPYSDELTAAINGSLLGGTARLKGIFREGRNVFARSPMQTQVVANGDGTTTTKRYYTMTNDGETSYRGASFEWTRSFGKHAVALSLNYSKTKRTNPDYLQDVDDILFEPVPILFQGETRTSAEIAAMNQDADFASPLLANASWLAAWLHDRLRTNLSVHYRNGFRRIEDSGVDQTIGGVRYSVFDCVSYPDSVDVDLNLQADVVRSSLGTLTLDLRLANLLDTIPARDYVSTTEPYQYGRSAWVGLKFRF